MLKFVDTHCHLYMDELRGDGDVLSRMVDAGVSRAVVIGCDEVSSFDALRFAHDHADAGIEFRVTVGVHPHDASTVIDGLPEELTDLADNRMVGAVGEIGLDFWYDNSPRDVQRDVFERQIDWAKRAGKPIVLHLRNAEDRSDGDAYGEAMRAIKRSGIPPRGGVVHCFSGDADDARTALDLGFYVSFAGPVTYPKAAALREAAAIVPLDRILCETDSPYLAPQSHRGRRNEPSYVPEVYEKVAGVKGISVEGLTEAVWQNAEKIFGF